MFSYVKSQEGGYVSNDQKLFMSTWEVAVVNLDELDIIDPKV